MDSGLKSKYKVVFFDLDHTLWDYDRNARNTLGLLYEKYLSGRHKTTLAPFLDEFIRINDIVWEKYDQGIIQREDVRIIRFIELFKFFGIEDDHLALQMSEEYMIHGPLQTHLVPGALEVLENLSKKYTLYVITNGFDDVQRKKLNSSGTTHYFKDIITSEMAGVKKPSSEIFDYAIKKAGCSKSEAIMVGDNLLTDIAGAVGFGMDVVFFNTKNKTHNTPVTHEISGLCELMDVL